MVCMTESTDIDCSFVFHKPPLEQFHGFTTRDGASREERRGSRERGEERGGRERRGEGVEGREGHECAEKRKH